MINRNNILATAAKEIGYREGQNNDNKFGREIGCNNQPWCAMFVFWVLRQNGITVPGDWAPAKRQGYVGCPALYRDAKKNGWLTDNPEPGDLILFDWNKDKNADHIGIFQAQTENNIASIEGNTGDNNWSNGDGVYSRMRNKKLVLGYVSLDKMVGTLPDENGEQEFEVWKRGDKGEMVKKIQEALNRDCTEAGFPNPLKVDGDYGPNTAAFIVAFQTRKGLTIDGICGPETLKALGL